MKWKRSRLIHANSSRQILPNLTSNCELTKLQDENNALKQRLRDVEDRYDSLEREAKSIQDENESLMTALKLLNNEINMNISRSKICMMRKPLGWRTGSDNKTMPRDKKRERQLPVGRKILLTSRVSNNKQRADHSHRWWLHNKECSGNKTSEDCGTTGCYQAVPRTTIRYMRLHIYCSYNW